MVDYEKIKKEIVDVIKEKYSSNKSLEKILIQVNKELDLFEATEGLESKNNLETFYSIWKKSSGREGSKNGINSWTAYALGMTSKKPEGEFLPLRRAFARAGFPDVDTDFDDEKRDDVYEYIIDKYGRENVGNIGTHGQLKFKSCVTRVVKALDIANSFSKDKDSNYITDNVAKVNEILDPFPKKGLMKVKDENGESHLIKTFKDAYKHCPDFRYYVDKYPEIKLHCENIEGGFANFGCLSKDTPILTNKGWIRIDQLTTKYKIAYINKDKEVEYTNKFRSFRIGNKKTYRLKLKNNGFIDVTDEHLIFTDKGCVKFENIRKNSKEYKIYGLEKGIY